MPGTIQISVVIPTCNRKGSLLRVLNTLHESTFHIHEVIVVDSSDIAQEQEEFNSFDHFRIHYIRSQKSVCIQRNIGIRLASSPWIFLCDDDLEVPSDYLEILAGHANANPEAGAISGLVLQHENSKWDEQYPVTSASTLLWKFIFQLGIWGEIRVNGKLSRHYQQKKNHISNSGWPVITDFSGAYFKTPVYGLGASLVRKKWLLDSPYDEVLDSHGIGDNYGVAAGFPDEGIHVVKRAFVYHHQANENRLSAALRYYRRILALHFFIKTKIKLRHIRLADFAWSLFGNFIAHSKDGDTAKMKASFKALMKMLLGKNPYLNGIRHHQKVVEPLLEE
jgi:glycosyltransferase involved in cell wall biosynthesis